MSDDENPRDKIATVSLRAVVSIYKQWGKLEIEKIIKGIARW